MGLTVVEIDRRRQLSSDLAALATKVADLKPHLEQVDRILTWDLSVAAQALNRLAESVLDLEDGSRIDLGADAAVRP